VKNGQETGVDCGGEGCPACGVGEGCIYADDCSSKHCEESECVAAPTASPIESASPTAFPASLAPSSAPTSSSPTSSASPLATVKVTLTLSGFDANNLPTPDSAEEVSLFSSISVAVLLTLPTATAVRVVSISFIDPARRRLSLGNLVVALYISFAAAQPPPAVADILWQDLAANVDSDALAGVEIGGVEVSWEGGEGGNEGGGGILLTGRAFRLSTILPAVLLGLGLAGWGCAAMAAVQSNTHAAAFRDSEFANENPLHSNY